MTGSSTEPKTGAAVMALPEAEPPFRQVTCGNCKHTINIPVARRAFAQHHSPDSILFVRDAWGVAWRPVLTEDGTWRRERTHY
jgi:hypothetical protein